MSAIDLHGLAEPATVGQLAEWLGTGDECVRQAIKRGDLQAHRITRRGDLRIFREGVRRWLAADSTTASTGAPQ